MKKTHMPIYISHEKAAWRKHIHEILQVNNCHTLLSSCGKLRYRWLESIGENALPFKQLLSTSKIQENQLIGIDRDPYDPQLSLNNIERCKTLYPQAEFHCEDWIEYCRGSKNHKGIGYIITDVYVATGGDNFERTVQASLHIAEKSKKEIGEVLFVINADLEQARRFQRGTKDSFAQATEKVFRTRSHIEEFRKMKFYPESIYTYKNPGKRHEMATIIAIL